MYICKYLLRFFKFKKKKQLAIEKIVYGLNKTDNIRQHLIEYKTINNRQAFHLYDITRLSSIVYRLKKQGMHIDSFKSKTTAKNGKSLITITSYVY